MKRAICFLLLIALMLGAIPGYAGDALAPATDLNAAGGEEDSARRADLDISRDADAFRGVPWEAGPEETAATESATQRGQTVTVSKGVVLYEVAASKLVYRFADDVMRSRTFTIQKNNSAVFAVLMYELCMRYGAPFISVKRKAIWQAGALNVALQRGDDFTLTYTLSR